ncbi:hypothetical protein [uncultured Desulfuromonas sp.]|nr:hypothetical protein [uncultured Desulfuromonas sp.]
MTEKHLLHGQVAQAIAALGQLFKQMFQSVARLLRQAGFKQADQ